MRHRLTAKTLKAESIQDGMCPSYVGQPDRPEKTDRKLDEYNNTASEFKSGWDLKEGVENDWKESNQHDENGWGVRNSKLASAALRFRTAKKATILANMLLGDKAPVSEIKAQAKEFMALGYRGICASIRRYAATEPCEECEEEVQASAEAPVETQAPEEAPVAAEEVEEAPVAEEAAPAEDAPEAPAAEEASVEETEEAEETPAVAEEVDELSQVEEIEEDEEAPVENTEAPDMMIDIPEEEDAIGQEAFNPDAQVSEAQPDPELESAFLGEDAPEAPVQEETPAPVTARRKATKAGIKHLAGNPRLASKKFSKDELAGLWTGLEVRSF